MVNAVTLVAAIRLVLENGRRSCRNGRPDEVLVWIVLEWPSEDFGAKRFL